MSAKRHDIENITDEVIIVEQPGGAERFARAEHATRPDKLSTFTFRRVDGGYNASAVHLAERGFVVEAAHRVAPDAGRNVQCACGAEYSQVRNLMRHITDANLEAEAEAIVAKVADLLEPTEAKRMRSSLVISLAEGRPADAAARRAFRSLSSHRLGYASTMSGEAWAALQLIEARL